MHLPSRSLPDDLEFQLVQSRVAGANLIELRQVLKYRSDKDSYRAVVTFRRYDQVLIV